MEGDTPHDTPRGGLGSSSRTAFGSLILPSTFQFTDRSHFRNAGSWESLAIPDSEKKSKKKRSEGKDEYQVQSARRKADALVSEANAISDGKTVDVGGYHLERPLDRRDKSKKITTFREDTSKNLATKKKKGERKKLEIREETIIPS